MYVPIINAGRFGFNLIPPVLRPMPIFLYRNPAWPKEVFGLWKFETDQLSEDGQHCLYMIYLWWEMNYGGSSPSEFLFKLRAFECLFEKWTDGSKLTTLDVNIWPPSQVHAATKNSKQTLISEVDNQHKFMFLHVFVIITHHGPF